MKLYGGIDLHSNNSVVVLLDEQDTVHYHRRLPNDLAVILGELAAFGEGIEGLVSMAEHSDGLMFTKIEGRPDRSWQVSPRWGSA
jgi:hypothetical protein